MYNSYILIPKNFGRPKFRTKFCPKLQTSEIFCVRNLKASEIFGDPIIFQKYFQDLVHRSLVKIFLFTTYVLLVTSTELQLQVILEEIFQRGYFETQFFHHECCQFRQSCQS